jgi:hypothetical protein
MDARQTFIYGAFLTPDQADSMYAPAKEEVKVNENELAPPNTTETSPAAQNTELKDKIEDDSFSITPPPQSTTQGDSKPATPPTPPPAASEKVDFKLIGSNQLNPTLNPGGVTKYYINIRKPNNNYITYEIKDGRADCCVDTDGLNVNPSISLNWKLAQTQQEALNSEGKLKVTKSNGNYVDGQKTFMFDYEEDANYDWDGKLNITVFYNPGKNKTTGFQQEVVYNDQINIK